MPCSGALAVSRLEGGKAEVVAFAIERVSLGAQRTTWTGRLSQPHSRRVLIAAI